MAADTIFSMSGIQTAATRKAAVRPPYWICGPSVLIRTGNMLWNISLHLPLHQRQPGQVFNLLSRVTRLRFTKARNRPRRLETVRRMLRVLRDSLRPFHGGDESERGGAGAARFARCVRAAPGSRPLKGEFIFDPIRIRSR